MLCSDSHQEEVCACFKGRGVRGSGKEVLGGGRSHPAQPEMASWRCVPAPNTAWRGHEDTSASCFFEIC